MNRVSCIMPTADRRHFMPQAIRYFLRQDYPHRELIVVDDGDDPVEDLLPDDSRIRYFRLAGREAVGAKRNFACRKASGELIAHWDDDDWMADWRLSYQVAGLLEARADACGLQRPLYYEPASIKAWRYVYPPTRRPWVAGGTLCYTRELWRRNPFFDGGDAPAHGFLWNGPVKKVLALEDQRFYVGLIHPGNASPKNTSNCRWHPAGVAEARETIGDAWPFYQGLELSSLRSHTGGIRALVR